MDQALNYEERANLKVVAEIEKKINMWHWYAKLLRFVHIGIGLVATISSITIASKAFDGTFPFLWYTVDGRALGPWIAWLTAISTGILTSFNLGKKSNNMRSAWRKLNAAKMIYDSSAKKDTPICNLIKAYEKGEEIIGDVEIKMPE